MTTVNLGAANKNRIIIKAAPNATIASILNRSANLITPHQIQQRQNGPQQVRAINLYPQTTLNTSSQLTIINNQQQRFVVQPSALNNTLLNGQSSIIVLAPTNTTIPIQQTVQKPIVQSDAQPKPVSSKLFSLINSDPAPISAPIVRQPEPILNKPNPVKQVTKEQVTITPVTSCLSSNHKISKIITKPPEKQTEELDDKLLNNLILPNTRMFASLLNKDDSKPNGSESLNSGKQNKLADLSLKTVIIDNKEHYILDNLNNLSDFSNSFEELKNIASLLADHLNKPVSIPAFLMINQQPGDTKENGIMDILKDKNIQPILIEKENNDLIVNVSKPNTKDNSSQAKLEHPYLIESLNKPILNATPSTEQPTTSNNIVMNKKRTSKKRKNSQIILNSSVNPVNNTTMDMKPPEQVKLEDSCIKRIKIEETESCSKLNETIVTANPSSETKPPIFDAADCVKSENFDLLNTFESLISDQGLKNIFTKPDDFENDDLNVLALNNLNECLSKDLNNDIGTNSFVMSQDSVISMQNNVQPVISNSTITSNNDRNGSIVPSTGVDFNQFSFESTFVDTSEIFYNL